MGKKVLLLLLQLVIFAGCSVSGSSSGSLPPDPSEDYEGTVYTITFDANGGYGEMLPMYAKSGQSITLNMNIFSKMSSKFLGWSLSKSSNVIAYENGAVIDKVTSNMTLYAVWQYYSKTIKITFNKNGADLGFMGTIYTSYGASNVQLTPNSYMRSGYYFMGWATSPEATRAEYEDGYIFNTLEDDIDLYAVWQTEDGTGQKLFIYFDANGGSGLMSRLTLYRDTSIVLPSNNFYKSGYKFLGWSTRKGNSTVTYNDSDIISDIKYTLILYAVWEKL